MRNYQRREFLSQAAAAAGGIAVLPSLAGNVAFGNSNQEMFFKISLAEWSLNKTLFGGKLDNLDFPAKAKNDFGIEAVEFVNQFFKDKAEDKSYLKELKMRCNDIGVETVLIMVDGEGALGDSKIENRIKAVENHYKWVDAAKELGCHSIRVNAAGGGSYDELKEAAIDGLSRLSEYGQAAGIGIIVENHGGLSSNAEWLSEVMKGVNNPYCGTLPDFGNFCIKSKWENRQRTCIEEFDRYRGTELLMPFAKGVSAKTNAFDENGNEAVIDYLKIMKIVKDAGYTGYVGIEFEGSMDEDQGIMATKKLLEKVGQELS